MSESRRYRSVVLDVDSTLCGIEGIDWLAQRTGGEVAREIEELTDRAMRGEIALEDIYARRLLVTRPSRDDVAALSDAYIEALAPGAVNAIERWRKSGIRTVLVSGGISQALLPLARHVGIEESEVHAVEIFFDEAGNYKGFDRTSQLATAVGKRENVAGLSLAKPVAAVGDGATDLAIGEVADTFIAFTGFVSRRIVVEGADYVASTFDEVSAIVLASAARQ